jgi:carboxymethylenebutenolidase
MTGRIVEFDAAGKAARGYLATPASGQGPGLIVLQEWWGLVDHIQRVTDRFAAAGFCALAPDLYHGKTCGHPDDAGREMMALDIARTSDELAGAARFLLAQDACAPKKVGALGFCMGGQLALFAGCAHPDLVRAVVDFYGIHPKVEPDLSRLSGPVLAHFAKKDAFVTEPAARALVEAIAAAGKRVMAHFYDADHAFFNDSRPEVYSRADAELAFERSVAFLHGALA